MVRNRSDSTHELTIHPELTATQAHHVPLSDWGWVPPAAGSGEPITLSHAGLSATLEPQGEVDLHLDRQRRADV